MCSWGTDVVKKVESDRSPHLECDWSTELEYHYLCIINMLRKGPFMNFDRKITPLLLLPTLAAITIMSTPTFPVRVGVTCE
jgi:hypothetical protein